MQQSNNDTKRLAEEAIKATGLNVKEFAAAIPMSTRTIEGYLQARKMPDIAVFAFKLIKKNPDLLTKTLD